MNQLKTRPRHIDEEQLSNLKGESELLLQVKKKKKKRMIVFFLKSVKGGRDNIEKGEGDAKEDHKDVLAG